MSADRIKFNIADRNSPTWLKLKAHLEQRLARLRAENDLDMDESLTAKKRGQIAEIKVLISLDRDPAIPD